MKTFYAHSRPTAAQRWLRKFALRSVAASLCVGWACTVSLQAECPIPTAAQPGIAEIVTKLTLDVSFVASNVHFRDRGFALSLFGVDQGKVGQVLLAEECSKPKVFRAYYERSEDGKSISRLRLACDALGVDSAGIAIASGRRAASEAFRLLKYDTTRFAGSARYEPYPTVDWRTVKTAEGNFTVSAAVFRRLIFTPTGGQPLDLTHSGMLSGGVSANEPVWATVHTVFPSIAGGALPVIAEVQIDEHGMASGSIRQNAEVLAVISGTGFEPVITWQGQCAPPPAGP